MEGVCIHYMLKLNMSLTLGGILMAILDMHHILTV